MVWCVSLFSLDNSGTLQTITLQHRGLILRCTCSQIHQERMYQDYTLSRAEVQVKQLEKMLNQQNQSRELDLGAMRGEISSLKKVPSELQLSHWLSTEAKGWMMRSTCVL